MAFDFDLCFQQMMSKNKLSQVLIVGHMNPDGDACGCVMGMAHYIHTIYPEIKVYPYLAETLDKGPKEFLSFERVYAPFTEPDIVGDYAAIACDTATKARMIGWDLYDKAKATMAVDHHASNEGYGMENYVEISEACSANLFYAFQKNLSKAALEEFPNVCDYLYLGILHDTSCFQRTDEGIFHAASELLKLGVNHNQLMKTLQIQTLEDKEKESYLLKKAERALKGKAAYVYVSREEAEKSEITYEDIHPISGLLRDCKDIELGFTMYEEEKNIWRCSFRSDGKWINVNELLSPFGGGGHKAAAGIRKETGEPEKLLNDILEYAEKICQH